MQNGEKQPSSLEPMQLLTRLMNILLRTLKVSLENMDAIGSLRPLVLRTQFKSAISIVCNGGSITLIGNVSPLIELPLQQIVTREITLYGSCAIAGEYPIVLDMMARKRLNVLPLISVTDSLAMGATWFDTLYHKSQDLLKVVLVPQED